jgi:hypothetical protein
VTLDWEVICGIAFIAFFALVMWRGGSSNPVGTGHLQRQLQAIGVRLSRAETSLEACALSSEVEKLRGELREMEARVASSGEVLALEGQLVAVNTRIAGMERLVERTDAGVARLEGYFLEKGIKG